MEAVAAILVLAGTAVFLVSLIAVFKPLPSIWLSTRKHAIVGILASMVGCVTGGSMMPDEPQTQAVSSTMVATETVTTESQAAEITTDTPCTPTELSPAAVELVRLYEELHTFKDDIEFLDMGFSQAGPYYAWMEVVEAYQDANPGSVLFDELGFAANEVLIEGE